MHFADACPEEVEVEPPEAFRRDKTNDGTFAGLRPVSDVPQEIVNLSDLPNEGPNQPDATETANAEQSAGSGIQSSASDEGAPI